MVSTRNLCRIILLGLVSCCWSVGANVVTTIPPVADNVAAALSSNVASEPTVAPAPVAAAPAHGHTTIGPVGDQVAPAPAAAHLSTLAPAIVAPIHTVAPNKTADHKPSVVVVHTTVLPLAAAHALATGNASTQAHCTGFCEYIEPICESLDKISAKQMFKIQTQFKQFVQKTNGQMSLCFVEHYSLDPTFKAVSHDDLKTICASKKHVEGAPAKGSFQAFQACATSHWDPELNKDLALIKESRANSTAHQHPKSDAVAHNIEHDEEELSMISEVVNKVLGSQGGDVNAKNSDVKVIDVSGGAKSSAATTIGPVVNGSAPALQGNKSASANKTAGTTASLLKDPNNTVMVFVDDKTTPAPALAANKTVAPTHAVAAHANLTTVHPILTTLKPVVPSSSPHPVVEAKTPASNSTTLAPLLSTKAPAINGTAHTTGIPSNGTSTVGPAPTTLKPAASTTVAPIVANVTTTVAPVTTKLPVTTPAGSLTTSVAPTVAVVSASTTKVPSSTVKPTTTIKPTTTLKPLETLEQILHRQEKEKQALDNKLKAERTKAFQQLKKQEGSGPTHTAAADAKIHQLEHERQMSIDPIGHTIKHQQYEAKKQSATKQ